MLLIDRYAYNNRLSKTNPFIKFAIVITCLIVTIMTKNWMLNLGIFILMVLLTTLVARIPLGSYLKILRLPMAFLGISLVAILISISDEDLYLWSIKVLGKYIGIAEKSLEDSRLLVTRAISAMSATFFLTLTTPLNSIIRVFKRLRLPDSIIELMVLIYRTIFIFLEEAGELYRAMELKFGNLGFENSLSSMGLLIRGLFLRVILRYRDMSTCLESRLYNGKFEIGD